MPFAHSVIRTWHWPTRGVQPYAASKLPNEEPTALWSSV